MKRTALFVILALAATAAAFAQSKPESAAPPASSYADSTYGFTISPPAFPKVHPGEGIMLLAMTGPLQGAFAPNVNVTVQAFKTTRDEYRAGTRAQFKSVGLTVLSEKDVTVSGRPAIAWDYEGTLPQGRLRFLALAVVDTDRVLLVTCTSASASFGENEKLFRACLDSFAIPARAD